MHRINLTSAWNCFSVSNGREVWARWFGCPTNVSPLEQVLLVAEPQVQMRLWLNEQSLVEAAPALAGVAITDRLCHRNLLVVPPPGTRAPQAKAWAAAIREGSLVATQANFPSAWGMISLVIAEEVVDFGAVANR